MTGDDQAKPGLPYDFSDPAECQRFLRDLAEGAARGRAIEALRPDGARLGAALLSYMDVYDQLVNLSAYKTATEAGRIDEGHNPAWDGPPWIPAAGSPAEREHQELVDAGWDHDWLQRTYDSDFGRVLRVVHRYHDAVVDHLRGIGILLRDSGVIRPPVALTRSALEGAAYVAHLCDSGHSAVDRLTQTLNIEIRHLKEEVQAEQWAQNHPRCKELRNEVSAITEVGRERGLQPAKNDHSCFAPLMTTRALTDWVLEQSAGQTWHMLSQFIHPLDGEGWRITLGPSARTERTHRDARIALKVLSALVAMSKARTALAWYTGWPLDMVQPAELALLNLWTHGAGMRDDVYGQLVDQTSTAQQSHDDPAW